MGLHRDDCPYLPGRSACTDHRLVLELSDSEFESLLERGWRKFGAALYRPVCEKCRECRPLRISLADFTPSRSQRRCQRRNADLIVRCDTPRLDPQRLALYNRYHASQQARRGWPPVNQEESDYALAFLNSPVPVQEISLWDGDRLVAVALTDITPNLISGVYHYHDPDSLDRGLGVMVMLEVIALARRLGKTWAHFGYYVADCPSLNYKSRFRPCEVLGDDGVWRSPPQSTAVL